METEIADAEHRKEEIEKELAENSTEFELVSNLYTELEALTTQLDINIDRWSELAERAPQG